MSTTTLSNGIANSYVEHSASKEFNSWLDMQYAISVSYCF